MKTFKELQERLAEAKVEAGRSDYGKASVRNKRRFGKEGEPAVFDASGERGKMIDQRRAEHKAKRGVKEGYKGTADLSKADPAAKKKVEDRIAKHFGTKRVPGGKMGVKEDHYRGTGEKVQARTKKWMDKKGQKGAPGLDAMKARTAEHKAKRGVKEEVDAYKYVVAKLKKKHGDGVLTKHDKRKPQSAADKAKVRAHQAKVDAENAA